ncbi:MAG: DNA mismatch repair protein MutS [Candidatus Eiseniibacteriota bacterium]
MESTPMLEQYRRLKAEHPTSILLFRMGDFYETFGDDALVASKVLGIALTSRDKKKDPLPLAGVPHHSVEGYLKRLVENGYSVAIAEQMEPPEGAKGLVERKVIEVVTPGTVTRLGLLDTSESNYILALCEGSDVWGVAVAEVSTGEFRVGEIAADRVASLALEFPAREVLVAGSRDRANHGAPLLADAVRDAAAAFAGAKVTEWEPVRFDPRSGREALERRFQVSSLDAFGLGVRGVGYGAAGALLDYLMSLKKSDLPQLQDVRPLRDGAPLVVDNVTLRNLEIFDSTAGPEGTLLHLLDRTETAMGARALRALLRSPSGDLNVIRARLDRTEVLAVSGSLRAEVRDRLHRVPDLERALGLLGSGRASPRDVGSLRDALRRLPAIRLTLEGRAHPALLAWREALPDLSTLCGRLEAALVEQLPLSSTQGGIIREGFDPELDRLRSDTSDVQRTVLELEMRERQRTGISNLRVIYNRVFGYVIEVTRSQLARVPDDYVRRQTLAGAERFVTPELTRMEDRIEAGSVESHRKEAAHFQGLRDVALAEMGPLHAAARVIAAMDVHMALADVAARERWARPEMVAGRTLRLKGARHPMVERSIEPGSFVPNDCELEGDTEQIWIITGPNMGGKSTFLRQVGLCVYLAQCGSYVPCEAATIGCTDRIFTRVGASDEIARGASTFFVEMRETAAILRQATDASLVLLDEIGRGTSTYDGLSLAWAVTEALHEGQRRKPRTLFATHYHELTELEESLPRVRNRTVRVAEQRGEIVFLHQIVPGRADRSYGIHVAQLAGVPADVLGRAREILARLEAEHPRLALGGAAGAAGVADRSGVTRDERGALLDELSALDVDAMTPLDALNELSRLRAKARSGEAR